MTYEVTGGIVRTSTNAMRRSLITDGTTLNATTMLGRRPPVGTLLNISQTFIAFAVENPDSDEPEGRTRHSKSMICVGTAVLGVFMAGGGPLSDILIDSLKPTYGDVLTPLDDQSDLEWPLPGMTSEQFADVNGGIEAVD